MIHYCKIIKSKERRHRDQLSREGFTLIELLLGLSIFALIAAGIYATFWGGIRLSHRSEPQNNVYREARWSLVLMAKEFENMVFYDFTKSYPDQSAFIGDDKKITFILDSDEGLKVVSYYLEAPQQSRIHKVMMGNVYSKNVSVTTKYSQASSAKYLIREETAFIDYLAGNDANVQKEIINMHFKENGLKFSYGHLQDKENDAFFWQSSWKHAYIPASVRVEIDLLSEEDEEGATTFTRDIFIPTGSLGQEET